MNELYIKVWNDGNLEIFKTMEELLEYAIKIDRPLECEFGNYAFLLDLVNQFDI